MRKRQQEGLDCAWHALQLRVAVHWSDGHCRLPASERVRRQSGGEQREVWNRRQSGARGTWMLPACLLSCRRWKERADSGEDEGVDRPAAESGTGEADEDTGRAAERDVTTAGETVEVVGGLRDGRTGTADVGKRSDNIVNDAVQTEGRKQAS